MNRFLIPFIVLIIAVSFFLLFFFLYDLRKVVTHSKEDIKNEISSSVAEKNAAVELTKKDEEHYVAKIEKALSNMYSKNSSLKKNKNPKSEDLNNNQNPLMNQEVDTRSVNKPKESNEILREIIVQEKHDFEKEKWLEYLRNTYFSAKKAFIEIMVERLGLSLQQKDDLMKIITETVENIVSIYDTWYESERSKEADLIFRENIHQCTLAENERIKNVLTTNQISGYDELVSGLKKMSSTTKFSDVR